MKNKRHMMQAEIDQLKAIEVAVSSFYWSILQTSETVQALYVEQQMTENLVKATRCLANARKLINKTRLEIENSPF